MTEFEMNQEFPSGSTSFQEQNKYITDMFSKFGAKTSQKQWIACVIKLNSSNRIKINFANKESIFVN